LAARLGVVILVLGVPHSAGSSSPNCSAPLR
jgi:hypothetical protein